MNYKYFKYNTLLIMLFDIDSQLSVYKDDISYIFIYEKLSVIFDDIYKVIYQNYNIDSDTKEGKKLIRILKKHGKNYK